MSQYLSISSLYSQSCNFAMFFTVPPQIFVSHIFEELCIEDVVQVLQLHRKTFEIGEFYQRVLRFALRRLAFGLGRCKTSLKTWLQIFEALKAGNFQSNCADLQRLNGLISFKHTRYCTERGDYVEPLPWSFRAGSVEPFIRFLWRECTASSSPFPSIRAATFVEVLGGEKKQFYKDDLWRSLLWMRPIVKMEWKMSFSTWPPCCSWMTWKLHCFWHGLLIFKRSLSLSCWMLRLDSWDVFLFWESFPNERNWNCNCQKNMSFFFEKADF